MNKVKLFSFLLVFLGLTACQSQVKTTGKDRATLIANDQGFPDSEIPGIPIDYEKTNTIQTVYVTERKGTDIKQGAALTSETLGRCTFGANLDVIEIQDKWLAIKDRIGRKVAYNGKDIEVSRWEKVYVLKAATGPLSSITLIPEDLPIVASITIDEKPKDIEVGTVLKEYVKLELVSEEEFKSKKRSSTFVTDTSLFKNKNGVLELPCKTKTKKFIDKPTSDPDEAYYSYAGQVPFLNAYLVAGTYWEYHDYTFVDKTLGEVTQTFRDFPYISPDQKSIICLLADPYGGTGDLELYAIQDGKTKLIVQLSFSNWMPDADIFWSDDGCLYATVRHIAAYWNEKGSYNDSNQYVRIKVIS